MSKLKNIEGMCPVLGYGVDSEAACLIMPNYEGSLREWRLQRPDLAWCSAERAYFQYLQLCWQATHYVQVVPLPVCLLSFPLYSCTRTVP